ncbi:transmembrane 14C [Babesia caballi]|uniref:Transmembrane 14C n=1 Tax=Babesia caballi TaxID=5871 RepID=A0AAV4LM90_BABCB|nr:transmembrane 14C [Babesia caballi]
MLTLFVIPGLLCSAFFMGGGVYAYAAKRSVVSLVTAMAFSAMYAGCSYAILANPAGHLGYCLTAAASMFPLGLGSYKLFFQEHSTVGRT